MGGLHYSPSFSYVTPDLEEVKMPAEMKQKEIQQLLHSAHLHHKCYSLAFWEDTQKG